MSLENVVIGIDIGTAFSSIGVWDTELSRARLIADEFGRTRISSSVAFLETHRVIGTGDTDMVTENTIFGTKRLMGRKLCDQPSIVEGWPFNIEGNDFPSVSVRYKNHRKTYSCPEIMAMTISNLKHLAEYDLGCPLTDAVIGVFAYFTNIQRQSVMDAGIIAGLSVKQIVNEGSAAAIHYAVEEQVCGCKRVIVFDFGAGSVDVSVCLLEKGLCEIVASAGDTSLGGLDFDNWLVEYCVEEMKVKRKKDITKNKRTMLELRRSCERAKIELSSEDSTSTHTWHECSNI